MPNWTEGDMLTHRTRLHYYRTGGQKPPLVTAHGITDDGLCWTPLARALEADYDVIMVDQRAHGKSEAPATGYTYETMAAELAGLIEGLGLDKPAVLGHSMGAVTVLTMGAVYPDLPGKILLEDPPNRWEPRPQTQEDIEHLEGMVEWIEGLKTQTREELLAGVRETNPNWDEAELGPWLSSKLRLDPHILRLLEAKDDLPVRDPAVLKRITCPTLLLTGDPEMGAILSSEDAASLQTLIPHLTHAHIPGAGHNIRRDQFDGYVGVVGAFLGGD